MQTPSLLAAASLLAATLSANALADTSLGRFSAALKDLDDKGQRLLSLSNNGRKGTYPMIVRVRNQGAAERLDLIPITSQLAIGTHSLREWAKLTEQSAISSVRFSPTRHPLLDLAGPTVGLQESQQDFGLRGEGTIIGIVDTGIDAAHPSFMGPGNTSRIAWLLAFEQQPLGLHPELEELYGCTGGDPCAVYSREDIETLLNSGEAASLPQDPIGHGTHVASLAAGSDSTYAGIAPLSDLVIVAASDQFGGVSDARILLGTHFVFNRAEAADKAAVVNVSLGSSFGAHDGTSAVEEGLAELAQGPGRALVIAAGNSGLLETDVSENYPEPFGIHTEVAVPEGATVRIPLLTSLGFSSKTDGALFVWISTLKGDKLSVGFHNGAGAETPLIAPGDSAGFSSASLDDADDYDLAIVNGVDDDLEVGLLPGSAVVAIAGSWKSGRVFELVLKGSASARLWVTATGAADLHGGGAGPLFPRARTRGTVAIPGTQNDLITVGATLNHSSWTDYTGETVGFPEQAPGRAAFSSAGPNQLGRLKPELVAPGESVIGAMAQAADPRSGSNLFSLFSSAGTCPGDSECYVIDDEHGIASGTSMAAPIVSGAVALLMQREASLTMEEAKRYLMTGTKKLSGPSLGTLAGTGELDIVGSLLAQERAFDENYPSADPERSRVVWAESFLRPSPKSPLEGYLLLRDGEGVATSSSSELSVTVEGPGHIEWKPVGTGLIELSLIAEEGSGEQSVHVSVNVGSSLIARDEIPIAIDPIVAEKGFEFIGGSCSMTRLIPSGSPTSPYLSLLLTLSLGLFWRRTTGSPRGYSRAPHGARDLDRRGGKEQPHQGSFR